MFILLKKKHFSKLVSLINLSYVFIIILYIIHILPIIIKTIQ